MLNPSRADADTDDPTLRRCLAIAGRAGAGRLEVVNLFTFRTPSPADLVAWAASAESPQVEAEALGEIGAALSRLERSDLAICAWGGPPTGPAEFRRRRQDRIGSVLSLARDCGGPLVCLGRTRDGSPRHPLYVRADQPLAPFA
jgi:hypothetical protein